MGHFGILKRVVGQFNLKKGHSHIILDVWWSYSCSFNNENRGEKMKFCVPGTYSERCFGCSNTPRKCLVLCMVIYLFNFKVISIIL